MTYSTSYTVRRHSNVGAVVAIAYVVIVVTIILAVIKF